MSQELNTIFHKTTLCVMHQSFVSTVPPPTGMGGDNDFSFFRALVLAPPCVDKLMVTTVLLAPPFTTENLTGTAGTIKIFLPCTLAQLFHGYPCRWVPWIQMTGALCIITYIQNRQLFIKLIAFPCFFCD